MMALKNVIFSCFRLVQRNGKGKMTDFENCFLYFENYIPGIDEND
jgi:hypothetical protein